MPRPRPRRLGTRGLALAAAALPARGEVLDARKLLDAQTFWDNRDWDWCKANAPAFESPDPEIDTTYYYRWELLTKHLTYASTATGYTFTEFLDRPFWSGRYGAISCPAGHQLYEARWLKDPRYARDYARYWFQTPGAQPRSYSTWTADAVWAAHLVHPDDRFVTGLLPDLVRNYEGWEKSHFEPAVGLFWQTGHDDGMEYNINSRQTRDALRGAPGFRPTLNSYLWADARAIARVADPDTGSFEGHDSYNHGEHDFHSGYVDLIVTGLVGLRPRDDDVLEVDPRPRPAGRSSPSTTCLTAAAGSRSSGTVTGPATGWERACTCGQTAGRSPRPGP